METTIEQQETEFEMRPILAKLDSIGVNEHGTPVSTYRCLVTDGRFTVCPASTHDLCYSPFVTGIDTVDGYKPIK